MPETVYCDNYDELAGSTVAATVQVKVVEPPAPAQPDASTVAVETKAEGQ